MNKSQSTGSLVFSTILLFIANWLWKLLKIFIAVCIFIGAFRAITSGREESTSLFTTGFVSGVSEIATMLIENWSSVAIVVLLVWIGVMKFRQSKMETHLTHVKLAVVACMNYLNLEVKTEGLEHIRSKGMWSYVKQSLEMNILDNIFGTTTTDDTLTSLPVRHGERVSLQKDIQEWTVEK